MLSDDIIHAFLSDLTTELQAAKATKQDYLRIATVLISDILDIEAGSTQLETLANDLYGFCERRYNKANQQFRSN